MEKEARPPFEEEETKDESQIVSSVPSTIRSVKETRVVCINWSIANSFEIENKRLAPTPSQLAMTTLNFECRT